MKPALDLSKIAWRRPYGDVLALGSWYGKDNTPCIVLVATRAYGTPDAIPCVVPLANAWHWAEETGEPAYAVHNSLTFAGALGLNTADFRAPLKITSIIRDCLQDLLTMAPRPKDDTEVVADAIITDLDSGKQRHSEIVDNV